MIMQSTKRCGVCGEFLGCVIAFDVIHGDVHPECVEELTELLEEKKKKGWWQPEFRKGVLNTHGRP